MRYEDVTSGGNAGTPLHTRVQRHAAVELRFLVPATLAQQILARARGAMAADPHGSGPHGDTYRVTTICFETPAFHVHQRTGSYGRAKYRVRRYNQAAEVYLERKLRTREVLSKRRSSLSVGALGCLLNGAGRALPDAGWFIRRVAARQLKPICQVSYVRTARQIVSPRGASRLTVDTEIQAWPVDALQFVDGAGVTLASGSAVLELKFAGAAPPAFKTLVEQFGLAPGTFSKFRLALTGLGLISGEETTVKDQV